MNSWGLIPSSLISIWAGAMSVWVLVAETSSKGARIGGLLLLVLSVLAVVGNLWVAGKGDE